MTDPSVLLFLCSGNYYRSRFAEILFNALAAERGLAWHAHSRGLIVDLAANIGPIAADTVSRLRLQGIATPTEAVARRPSQLTPADLKGADRIIAVKEAEHRPLLRSRFPGWEDRVEYWHIHDLDVASADVALAELETAVRALVDQLQADRVG